MKWWGYLHTNGSVHTKRYLGDPLDLKEAKESPFVKMMHGPFEADSSEEARTTVRDHFRPYRVGN